MGVLSAAERRLVLSEAQSMVQARLLVLLLDLADQDLRDMSPAHRELLADALDRVPATIPLGLVQRLRVALATVPVEVTDAVA
ncbi:MAG: hypothetical protein H0X24_00790 [Ktedonobacterales bacterium]|nr:hypothetical protein [Ktedonobacterales bacterium]